MMRREKGRDMHDSEYSPKSEETGGQVGFERIGAPPSRHLWIGNLSIHMTQALLYDTFIRFGDIDNVIFIQGRSYAFVNYRNEEDAVVANRMLQGFVVSGLPLRVEFQKGDKSLATLDNDHEQNREERYSTDQGKSYEQRDSRLYSPENSYSEPNEVLRIGFPAFLNITEMMLRRAFSSFGDINKIMTFPGCTYAFVEYRSVVAACQAKKALQGKLFGNPRITLCFARSDMPLSEYGREFSTPSFRSSDGLREASQLDCKFDMPSTKTFSNMRQMPGGDTDGIIGFGQNDIRSRPSSNVFPGANVGNDFETTRFQGIGSEGLYDHHYRNSSPLVDRDLVHHDFPQVDMHLRDSNFDDSWDVKNDIFPLAKRIRADSDKYHDNELPDYLFSDFKREREYSSTPKFHSDREINRRGFASSIFSDRGLHNQSKRSIHQPEDDFWRAPDAEVGIGPVYLNPSSHQALIKDWRWEGTIAKSGTQVCRARCFPVGKSLDFMLPDYLDCTARTSLDMLSKHFYHADSSWVIFFVPETDADIVYYNEFMNYLGEKKRAAVSKLGEKTTLFLVPPSDFSECVLKVPGKMSISGVVLKFLQPTLNDLSSRLHEPNTNAQSFAKFQDQSSQMNHTLPDYDGSSKSQNYFCPSSEHINSGTSTGGVLPHPMEMISSSTYEEKSEHQLQHQNHNLQSDWHSRENVHMPNANSNNVGSSCTLDYPMGGEHEYPLLKSVTTQVMQQRASLTTPSIPGNSYNMPQQHEIVKPKQVSQSTSVPAFQPEQLAQLATLLEHKKRLAEGMTITTEPSLLASDPSISRLQQTKQYPSNISTAATNSAFDHHGHNSSQQIESHDREEEEKSDSQKQLQAALQLAATLLQKIQQKSN